MPSRFGAATWYERQATTSPAGVFTVGAAPGPHRLEVRLVNRTMRNGAQRRVRLS